MWNRTCNRNENNARRVNAMTFFSIRSLMSNPCWNRIVQHTLDSFVSGEISIRFLEITHLWWPHKLIFLWQDTTLIRLATLRPPLDPRLVGLKLNGQQVFTSAGVNISDTKNKQNSNNKFMVDWSRCWTCLYQKSFNVTNTSIFCRPYTQNHIIKSHTKYEITIFSKLPIFHKNCEAGAAMS